MGLQLALWTAGIVVCTLMVNAPLMPALLRWTRLNAISVVKTRMRGKAARALLRYTNTAIDDLQHDEDEMLRGGQLSLLCLQQDSELLAKKLMSMQVGGILCASQLIACQYRW